MLRLALASREIWLIRENPRYFFEIRSKGKCECDLLTYTPSSSFEKTSNNNKEQSDSSKNNMMLKLRKEVDQCKAL